LINIRLRKCQLTESLVELLGSSSELSVLDLELHWSLVLVLSTIVALGCLRGIPIFDFFIEASLSQASLSNQCFR